MISCSDSLNDAYNKKSGLDMVLVPEGTFQRDGTAGNTSTVSEFYMAKYLVTRAQFKNLTGYDPSDTTVSPKSDCPVQKVSWYETLVFCNRLSIREGLAPVYTISDSTNPDDWGTVPTAAGTAWDAVICNMNAGGYRLPTEMEYMWAAMGATSGAGDHTGGVYTNGYKKEFAGDPNPEATGDDIGPYAWYDQNSGDNGGSVNQKTHSVGTKKPNELGLYDMTSNVYRWCWDGLVDKAYPFPTGSVKDYQGDSTTTYRIIRGGCFNEGLSPTKIAINRWSNYGPDSKIATVGFRVARSAGTGYIPRTGLVGEWLFDGNMYDTSGSDANGVPTGSPLPVTDRHGNASSAYSFDGAQYIICTKTSGYPKVSAAQTISVWINEDGTYNGHNPVVDINQYDGPHGQTVIESNSGSLDVYCWGMTPLVTTTPPLISKWHHIVYTNDGNKNLNLYIDGAIVQSTATTATTNYDGQTASQVIHIGNHDPSQYFSGYIDNVRVYNRALSLTEVKELYDE